MDDARASHPDADPARRRDLCDGPIEVLGRMPYSSNATLLVEVRGPRGPVHAVYKPGRGERPLWDFPPDLFRREIAAYELSLALGWDLVPTTVERDGPYGPGSLQLLVEVDPDEHYFRLIEDERRWGQLQRICLFDLLANNTDRKGGHCLGAPDGHIWAVDNALCFHAGFKLRTVIWDFAGEPMPDVALADVAALVEAGLPDPLAALLDPLERDALAVRARAVLEERTFPHDHTGRRFPWPMV